MRELKYDKHVPVEHKPLNRITYFEAHPINGFSHLSIVSNSKCHFFVLNVPDCIAVLAGTKILALRSLTIQSGTPVVVTSYIIQ